MRELRAIVEIGQSQLLLQAEVPKAKSNSRKKVTPQTQAAQLPLIPTVFTSDEKARIEKLVKEIKCQSPAQIFEAIKNSDPIRRSAAIRANALLRAAGFCENCGERAPFETEDGPYLEGHHIERLADGGEDSIENVIALCPNCHRKAHYSVKLDVFQRALKQIMAGKFII